MTDKNVEVFAADKGRELSTDVSTKKSEVLVEDLGERVVFSMEVTGREKVVKELDDNQAVVERRRLVVSERTIRISKKTE